eukprot:TRINITY_DN5155_c0_g1_i1.p1 TRINITY_DN5155_c0_g1~~TRINITY_DN5155_c0_g1_i1.p1  ORF type:complete len:254 (-),score=92.88 TRINITY_DN5155_c0_g1_i1:233-994(-)
MGSPDLITASDGDPMDVNEYDEDSKDYAPRVLGATGDDEEEDEEADEDEEVDGASRRAASRVESIITKVTDQLAEAAADAEDVLADDEEAATVATGDHSRSPASNNSRGAKGAVATKRSRRNVARGADIARILAAPKKPPEVRQYIAEKDFGRVPVFLREVTAELDAEQRYIVSLHEPRDPPNVFVRLLTQVEKDHLVKGLKVRFQQATAKYLKATPKSRSKADLEAELEKIAQDIQNLDRPYIFVEDEDAFH